MKQSEDVRNRQKVGRKLLPPLEDHPVFQDLVRDLKQQTPEQRARCEAMLDEMANSQERGV